MKKIIPIMTLIILFITAIPANASFDNIEGHTIPIDISVYGEYLKMPRPAFIEGGTTYAPARALCEALGAYVWWDADTGTVFAAKDGTELNFNVNNSTCNVGGSTIYAKIHIVDGSAFVPIRILSEAFLFSVGWDSTYYEVTISKEGLYLDEYHMASYTREDVSWLSKIVQKEAGFESFECRLGVANVVLNRVKSTSFPNTIYEVIFDTNYGVQFPPAHNGGLDNLTLSPSTIIAAKCALNGDNNVGNSLYFIQASSKGSFAERNRHYNCTIGNEKFFN